MNENLQIIRRLSSALVGHVKIKQLDQLLFEDIDTFGAQAYDQSKTQQLLHSFEYEGCRRLDPLTWIPCALKQSDIQLFKDLKTDDDPKVINLPEGLQVCCFQGQHRVAAAKQWLPPTDIWWNFCLYDLDKLDEGCRRRLREYEAKVRTFSDGEIFRNIRHYQQKGITMAANEWLARWSVTKCREFRRIYEPKANQKELRHLGQRLDKLLCFPALWTSWYMGTHLPSLNCPEELTYALQGIYDAWQILTSNTPYILDPGTLEMLEGRCPCFSLADRRYINEIFQNGAAFPLAKSLELRSRLLDAALNYPRVIPSLRTFLESTKYIKAMTDVVKKILPKNSKGSILRTLHQYYMPPQGSKFQIQCSDNSFIQRQQSEEYGFWSAYRQLFLFAMRHFCGLTGAQPLGFSQASRSRCPQQLELTQKLLNLVHTLGFRLPGYRDTPRADHSDLIAIRGLLTRLRPPESFIYTEGDVSMFSSKVNSILASIVAPRNNEEIPSHSWDNVEDWSFQLRCGMTDTETFFSDGKYLFLDNIYSSDQSARENMTSFAVKRNTFRLFFCDFKEDSGLHSGETIEEDYQQPLQLPVDGDEDMGGGGDMLGEGDIMEDEDMIGDEDIVVSKICQITAPEDTAQDNPQRLHLDSPPDNTPEKLLLDSPPIVITRQSTQSCECTVHLTPEDLYKSIPASYEAIIFYEMESQKALFFRHEDTRHFLNLAEGLSERWFAIVESFEDGCCLKNSSLVHLFEYVKGKQLAFFCHGLAGTKFTSPVFPKMKKPGLELPRFNLETRMWELWQGPGQDVLMDDNPY
ncbi:hypothetical protein N7466_007316 [Penicillium verhagenii]|uniref:uncharacterized protein n=1 Tax=Penicillium verhagenii TaxID=1562060 RepID=UPI0025454198|nr:uncharacterized protein N7466_007316 [Penicillium verhagenii]KAJ5928360.1 hypothetical protein N7466_007316 [Penicillium verhagenii]